MIIIMYALIDTVIMIHYLVQCSRTAALNSFFADFPYTNSPSQQTTTFLALLCCGCSPATIPVAEISHYWNIPQVYES